MGCGNRILCVLRVLCGEIKGDSNHRDHREHRELQGINDPSAFSQGSVAVRSTFDLGGVIRFEIAGIGVAGVGAAPAVSRAVAPVKRVAGGINTGLAIRNGSQSETATVTLRLRDLQGKEVADGMTTLMLAPNARVAQFINELFGTAQTDDFQGTVTIESSIPLVVIALGLGQAGRFTTLPVTERP